MKKITLVLTLLAFTFSFAQTFPIDFSTSEDTFTGDGGAAFALAANPIDASDQVGQITANGGQYENVQLDLATYLDLTTANKTITFDYYSTTTTPALMKLESTLNGNYAIEMSFTPAGSGWESISLDFANATNSWPNTADPVTFDQYAKVVIFPDFGVTSTGTYYVDDIAGAANGGATPVPITSLVVDFETATSFVGDSGSTYQDQVANDVTTGINSSATVGQASAVNNGSWANTQLSVPEGLDLSAGDKGFSLMVKGTRAVQVKFKLEGGTPTERDANYTTTNSWQKLTWDFSSETSINQNKLVLFFDIQGAASATASDDVFMIDNLEFGVFSSLSTQSFEIDSSIKMFPNPAKDVVQFSKHSIEPLDIQIFDMLGKQLIAHKNVQSEVNISSLRTGVYFVQMTLGAKATTKKLVVH